MPNERYAHYKDFSSSGLPFSERRREWLEVSDMTEAEFDAMMAREKAREPRVPGVGDTAPDFTAERLDRRRRRTGEFVTLSRLRGRPVALAFGSYT